MKYGTCCSHAHQQYPCNILCVQKICPIQIGISMIYFQCELWCKLWILFKGLNMLHTLKDYKNIRDIDTVLKKAYCKIEGGDMKTNVAQFYTCYGTNLNRIY